VISIKILVALMILFFSFVSLFTILEIFGREDRRLSIDKLKSFHKISGRMLFVLIIVNVLLGIYMLTKLATEGINFSAFGVIHAILATVVLIIFFLKILFIKRYNKFYNHAKVLGILLVFFTIFLFSVSGGYKIINRLGLYFYQ